MLGTLPELAPPKNFFIDDLMLARRRRAKRNQGAGWIVRSVAASAAVLMMFAVGGDVTGVILNGGGGSPSAANTLKVDQAKPQSAAAPVSSEATSSRSTTDISTQAGSPVVLASSHGFDALPFRVAEAGAFVLLVASGGALYYLRR